MLYNLQVKLLSYWFESRFYWFESRLNILSVRLIKLEITWALVFFYSSLKIYSWIVLLNNRLEEQNLTFFLLMTCIGVFFNQKIFTIELFYNNGFRDNIVMELFF